MYLANGRTCCHGLRFPAGQYEAEDNGLEAEVVVLESPEGVTTRTRDNAAEAERAAAEQGEQEIQSRVGSALHSDTRIKKRAPGEQVYPQKRPASDAGARDPADELRRQHGDHRVAEVRAAA